MMFANVKAACQAYVELKLRGYDDVPSAFKEVDKYTTTYVRHWICYDCQHVTDNHTGECPECGGDLIVYKTASKTQETNEPSHSDRLDRVHFIVDFEKMLTQLTLLEQRLLLYYGYSDLYTVVKYMLNEYNIKNTCENMDYITSMIKKAEVKLEEILIEKEYMIANESANLTRSRRLYKNIPKKHLTIAERLKR